MQSTIQNWSLLVDTADAPPPFVWQGRSVVPVEFAQYELSLEVDVSQRRAVGRARIDFSVAQRGWPLMEMVPSPSRVEINGQSLPVSRFPEVTPPNQEARVRVLDLELGPDAQHQLVIEYELTSASVSFDDGGVRLAFFMTDLEERGYLEQHAPANLEFNQFPLTVIIKLIGATKEHRLFTNGTSIPSADGWRIDFPDYFCSSSFFLHLTNRALHVQKDEFNGQERRFPVVAYGDRPEKVKEAINIARMVLAEIEGTYGPYAHDALTMYITDDLNGGGMEYCGATMTGVGVLGHEILHSWFARGVMPANGNAGWIDEGIARWRDYNYPRRRPDPNREPVNLGGFSPYRRHTPWTAYAFGSLLFSELDFLFKKGSSGLRPVLSKLYQQKKRHQITTEYLLSFLERETGTDLAKMFQRFVYGRPSGEFLTFEQHADARMATVRALSEFEATASVRPRRPFTLEELKALR
jgi:hypothetical protein